MKHSPDPLDLDQKDRIILSILQRDAEVSLAEIGERLGVTKMTVSKRIRDLVEARVLQGAHYTVDPEKVRQDYLTVTQVTCNVPGPEQEKVGSKIAAIKGVQTVYLCFGPYDILFIARTEDKQAAKNLLYEVSHIPGVGNTRTALPHTIVKESLEVTVLEK